LEIDGVSLDFDDAALQLIAEKALKRKTGARGLRSIIETTMRNVMYEIPSVKGVTNCRITRETIEKGIDPLLTYGNKKKQSAKKSITSEESA
jgi:ATP-dependent Clp protease ATP-binding subunit ClpX